MRVYADDSRSVALDRGELGHVVQPASLRVRLAQRLFQGSGWTGVRLALDVVLLALSTAAAWLGAPDTVAPSGSAELLLWLFPPLVLFLFALRGLYRGDLQVRVSDDAGTVVAATSLAAAGLMAAATFIDPGTDAAEMVARVWLFATLYLTGGRILLAWGQKRARVSRLIGKPTLLVGAGQVGAQVERRLREQPELGLDPLGYLDADPPPAEMVPEREAPVLGHPGELGRVADETGARHVVLGFTSAPDSLLIPLVRECESRGLEVSLVPRLFESVNIRVALEHIGGLPLYGLHAVDTKGWKFTVKHALDRVVAAVAIVLLSPLLVGIAIAVKLSSPGPVLFRQRRIGRDGQDFDMLKFRSMRVPEDAAEAQAIAEGRESAADQAPGGIEGADRRTRVGTFIRSTSLDELAQLFNVAGGQMSLVGPRPERPEFVEMFGRRVHRYDDRHRVKSGITGWAQVHRLRGKTSLRDRIEFDNYYIENWSLSLDLKILLMTVAAVFHRAE